jgi:hypothetical protein
VLVFALLAGNLQAQYTEQGTKLVGSLTNGAVAQQGTSVGLSTDGNTAIIGGPFDSNGVGGAWIFTRTNLTWTQQTKLTGLSPAGNPNQGITAAISGDGQTAIVGGTQDAGNFGALWVFVISNHIWTQQAKIYALDASGIVNFGCSMSISADGNIAMVGGSSDNNGVGAAFPYIRQNGTWYQLGSKIIPSSAPQEYQGWSVGVSGDGYTAIIGGIGDNNSSGAAWIYTRDSNNNWNQQAKLTGAPFGGTLGYAVGLSADGNTAIVGAPGEGVTYIFVRNNSTWTLQTKLAVANGSGQTQQGSSVAISSDGNTAVVGGPQDNSFTGAAWVFKRSNGVWTQQAKLVANDATGPAKQGYAVAVSGDGSTVFSGGPQDNFNAGAAFAFAQNVTGTPVPAGVNPAGGGGSPELFEFTFTDSGGWQNLTLVNVLINNVLDGRRACYIAFVPGAAGTGSLYLVDDAGDAGGPYSGLVVPGGGIVQNNQCSITGAGTSVTSSGPSLTLTLPITFSVPFNGNKVVYMAAQEAASNSGWAPLGTWYVPGPLSDLPRAQSVDPNRGTGLPQLYTFTFTDPLGWQDLTIANVLINNAINGVGACYLAFVPSSASSGSLYLVDDAGDAGGPYSGTMLPGSGTISNSQCSIAASGSSVTTSGSNLTLKLAMSFTSSFNGNRVVYGAAGNGRQNSGWQSVGTVAAK